MIVLLQGPNGCLRPRIAGPAHRLVARLQADRLTRALAAGCPQRELLELWRRVLAPGPVTVRGMALVHLLVTDGAGPLYYASCTDELRAACSEASAALDLFAAGGARAQGRRA